MNKSIYVSLLMICILYAYDNEAKTAAQAQQLIAKDEAQRAYMNHKTERFRYRHPKTNRYYASLWWHPPVTQIHPQRFYSPIRYFRNNSPYYWFY